LNIAVIKLGARITSGGTSGGSGEALAIIDMMKHYSNVVAYTKVLKKDEDIPNIETKCIVQNIDEIDPKNYDKLVVINGNVNFFGGAEDMHQIYNYKAMKQFYDAGGDIVYILCDPNLVLKNIWKSVCKKEWGCNYKQEEIDISNIEVSYITQPKNMNIKSEIKIKKQIHYPLEKFPLIYDKEFNTSFNKKEYNFLYGGTFRGGKREEDMIKFYFNQPNTAFFGNIKLKNFNEKKVKKLGFSLDDAPEFLPPVKYQEFTEFMSKAYATIIIGDKYYKEIDDLAQRIYESIQAGIITFIDEDYDRTKRVYDNELLRKLLYVKDGKNALEKLEKIKEKGSETYEKLIELQRKDTSINKDQYMKDFVKLIKEI